MTKTTARKPAPKPVRTRSGKVADARPVYEKVTDRIIAMLDAGVAPWTKPWTTGAAGAGYVDGAPAWFPRNAVSKKPYRGINVWLLLSAEGSYTDNRWVTFKQALDLGGNVRKGEKGTQIVLWRPTERTVTDANGDEQRKGSLFATTFTVFNVEQCENLKLAGLTDDEAVEATPPTKEERHLEAQAILVAYLDGAAGGPGGIAHHGDRAFYSPDFDAITLPPVVAFRTLDDYYTTAFHEAAHSTGHKSRLDRGFGTAFGDHRYSREELVAEFTASFLAAVSGIERTVDNSASYLQSWAKALKADPKALIQAASQAQKAADLILTAGERAEGEDEGEVAQAA